MLYVKQCMIANIKHFIRKKRSCNFLRHQLCDNFVTKKFTYIPLKVLLRCMLYSSIIQLIYLHDILISDICHQSW